MALSTRTLLASLLLTLFACDSGDPVDRPRPGDVAGIYAFTEFAFQPSGQGFQPIVVLDTLVESETSLRLASSGRFVLQYQFVNGDLYLPTGAFSVTEQTVRLDGDGADRADFERILLSDEFTLRRSEEQPGVLTAEISKTINPSRFSDRYAGVEQMSGALRIRLEKQ